MTAAHLAFLNAGVFLYVPKGVEIDTPIEAEIIQDATKDQPLNSHLLTVAEAQSKIHFLQHLQTVGERSVPANMMVEIVAQEGATSPSPHWMNWGLTPTFTSSGGPTLAAMLTLNGRLA